MSSLDTLKKIRKNFQLFRNKIGSKRRNAQLRNKDVTIISNNCFAGLAYEYLDLPYLSPTIGLYFFAPEYIKFIKKIKYYTTQELKQIKSNESKYYDELMKLKQDDKIICQLGDVEIVFLHYKSFKEAKEKWERRCKRINYDNIIYKFNDQHLCTDKEIEAFNAFEAKNKICFTARKYNYKDFVQLKRDRHRPYVKDDVFRYHKDLDIIEYINAIGHKKKILHLLFSSNYAGAENVACQIIQFFKKDSEYEMVYCAPDGPIRKTLKEKNIPFAPIHNMDRKSLIRVLKEEHINIIHAHDIRASVLAAMTIRKRDNIKIISHVHGNHIGMRKLTAKSLFYSLSSRRFEHIFWVSRPCLDNYIFKQQVLGKSSVLPNTIDNSEVIKKARTARNQATYDIVFIGRLIDAKDPLRVFDIMKQVVAQRPGTRCAIIGVGNYYDILAQKIVEEEMEGKIQLLGFLDNPYGVLRNAKVFLMASRHEGLPMVVLEAMALGVPIVSTPTDGIVDVIKNKDDGFLSSDNDELVKNIIIFMKKEKKYEKDENRINKDAIQNYKMQLLNIYNAGAHK